MSVIGIDASGKRVAIVHLSSKGTFLDAYYFETRPDDPLSYGQRFELIYDYLVVRDLRRGIVGVFVEDAYMGVSRRGSVNHAKVVGSVLAACSAYHLATDFPSPQTIMPATWRSRCGIKGRGKEPVAAWVKENYPTPKINNQDLADAACIAYAGLQILNDDMVDNMRSKGAI